jgi:capsular polysaccharide biosynthesis protein
VFLNSRERSASDKTDLRLYISRGDARRRKILNESEIRQSLESRGFQTVFAEKMGIAEMARLVSRAGYIFAPHGAGATNVVFGPRGIRLLESYSAHIAPEGWLLANAVGGRHYLLAGCDAEGRYPWDPEAYRDFSERDRNYADYSVRPQDLERALDIVLG